MSKKSIFTQNKVYLYLFDHYFCYSACGRGFFGENCINECIKTCDDCNDVNGQCDSGCIPGWTGYFCQKRNSILNCPDIFIMFLDKNEL